jgi:hypothetical protein
MSRWILLGVVCALGFAWWVIYKIAMWIQFLATGIRA